MAEIVVFNDGKLKAVTSKAFNVKVTHELMRMYSLSFSVASTDNIVKYINPSAQFLADGQYFDIVSYDINTGKNNETQIQANHVAYRLNKYKLNIFEYSYIGTVREIILDILKLSSDKNGKRAFDSFSLGDIPDTGTISFSLKNPEAVTAKYALMAFEQYGFECDFDNYTINFIKKDKKPKHTFSFGKDLIKMKRMWNESNGHTYQVSIANLQRACKDSDNEFNVGDYVIVDDCILKDKITKRIITYTKCLDDPTKDSLTLGNFISDVNEKIATMSIDIDKSIKQGEDYNNVSISHAEGFHANAIVDGVEIDTYMNASQGFEVRANGTTKFFVGGDGNVYTSAIGTDNFNYGTLGLLRDNSFGLELYELGNMFCSIVSLVGGGFALTDRNNIQRLDVSPDSTIIYDAYENRIFEETHTGDRQGIYIAFGENELRLLRDSSTLWFGSYNAVGADSGGAFKIENGYKSYL